MAASARKCCPKDFRGCVRVSLTAVTASRSRNIQETVPSHRHRPNRHIRVDDSGQALPRHPQYLVYRCFLPDLAGFTRLRRVGPNLQYRQPLTAAHQPGLKRGIQPRYSGLRVQGTASSPSSTISVTMVGEQGFTVNRSTFLVVSQLTGTGVVIHSSYRQRQVLRCNRCLDFLLDSGLRRNGKDHTYTLPC